MNRELEHADAKGWYGKTGWHLHREDGPAYITKNGYQSWVQDFGYYRCNGPARIWSNGRMELKKKGCAIRIVDDV